MTVCFDAIYILSREIPNILFVIVGDGPNRGDLAEYAEKLGITRNVLFLGKIPHETLLASDIYDYAKLFLTASCTETQGVTLLEAMSHGLPIVGVNEK